MEEAAQATGSLAAVHLELNDFEQAERFARQALSLLEGRVDFLHEIGPSQLVLGRALMEQGRLDEAEEAFKDADSSGHHRHVLRVDRQAHPRPRRERRGSEEAQDPGRRHKGALLLQIFSENQLGPILFEFIQRKGDDGFGEGNFKALFESIELDQIRRGVLAAAQ